MKSIREYSIGNGPSCGFGMEIRAFLPGIWMGQDARLTQILKLESGDAPKICAF